jgi:cyanate permease
VGIATISTFGNMALILNPWMMGKLHDHTGSFTTGSAFSAILLIAAAALALTLPISSKALGQARPL